MPALHPPLRFLLIMLVMLLGLAMTAPAGVATQDDDADDDPPAALAPQDDDDDESTAPAEIVAPSEGADTDDAGQGDEDPPDCDDGGWRIVTAEDGAGFRNEDHCEDHVADNGADSLVEVAAAEEDDAYVVVTVARPSRIDDPCTATMTLVDGQDGLSAYVVIDVSLNPQLLAILTVSSDHPTPSHTAQVDWGESLQDGIAMVLDDNGRPTEKTIPVLFARPFCG